MIPPRRQLINEFFKLIDLLVMSGSFLFAFWVATGRPPLQELIDNHFRIESITQAIGLLFVWHIIFHFFGLYGSRRLISPLREAFDVLKATFVISLVTNLTGFLIETKLGTVKLFVVFSVLSAATVLLFRTVFLRSFLGWARSHGRNLRNVLMVGTNSRARRFANMIEAKPELGFRVMGFVDEDWHGLEEALAEIDGQLVADFHTLDQYLRDTQVDEVVVALPFSTSYRESKRIVNMCEEQGIMVRFVSQFFDTRLAKAKVEMFQGEPVLTLQPRVFEGWQSVVKRVIDLSASTVMLLFLLPLFVVAAVAIKLSSPGPVFFIQRRIGLNKRSFPLYKFRTMVPDAEKMLAELEHLNEVSGPVFKIRKDPRITPIGRFLRKSSIDELPQLWNVFRGEMSLVGPRPLPLRDVEGFDRDRHRRRFSVRPGITCLWQVMGRSSIPFEVWMDLDLEYIDNWSLWLDLKILLKTIPVVFKPLVFGHAGEFQAPSKPLAEVLKFKNRPPAPDTGTVPTIKNSRGLT